MRFTCPSRFPEGPQPSDACGQHVRVHSHQQFRGRCTSFPRPCLRHNRFLGPRVAYQNPAFRAKDGFRFERFKTSRDHLHSWQRKVEAVELVAGRAEEVLGMHPVKLGTLQEKGGETTPLGRSKLDTTQTTHEEFVRWSPLIERKPSFTMPATPQHELLAAPVGNRADRLASGRS